MTIKCSDEIALELLLRVFYSSLYDDIHLIFGSVKSQKQYSEYVFYMTMN